jgi:hypothetical protein
MIGVIATNTYYFHIRLFRVQFMDILKKMINHMIDSISFFNQMPQYQKDFNFLTFNPVCSSQALTLFFYLCEKFNKT